MHDATLDERFRDNLLVTGPPYLRFYAGAPIFVKYKNEVFKVGTVCAIDRKPRASFSMQDKQLLLDMSKIVTDEIELYR